MKKSIVIALISLCIVNLLLRENTQAQNATITVDGSNLIGVCGDTIILRGVNYAPYNWSTDESDQKFAEIAKTGANCVRIPWFSSSIIGGGALYDDPTKLDSAISQCVKNKMIPVIELHDFTGNPDYTLLPLIAQWYLQPGIKFIIDRHKHNLIINIANEAGKVMTPAQLADFQNIYSGVVTTMRNGGIDVPLMIDAPNWGTDIDLLGVIAPALQANDPQHKLIFSAHAYWYYYTNNDSVIIRNKIVNALSTNVPWVIGEVSNQQDDVNPCQLTLNYNPLLKICQQLKVSWIAWLWEHDDCPSRDISTNGNYNALAVPFGYNIVNHPYYGLQTHSKRTTYLVHSQSCISGIGDNASIREYPFHVYTVDGDVVINSLVSESLVVHLFDLTGRELNTINIEGFSSRKIKLPFGIFIATSVYKHSLFSQKIPFTN